MAKFDRAPITCAGPRRHCAGQRSRTAWPAVDGHPNLLLAAQPPGPGRIEEEEHPGWYDGTLVVVSHDRRLLAGLRLDRRLEVVAGGVTEAPLPVAAPR